MKRQILKTINKSDMYKIEKCKLCFFELTHENMMSFNMKGRFDKIDEDKIKLEIDGISDKGAFKIAKKKSGTKIYFDYDFLKSRENIGVVIPNNIELIELDKNSPPVIGTVLKLFFTDKTTIYIDSSKYLLPADGSTILVLN